MHKTTVAVSDSGGGLMLAFDEVDGIIRSNKLLAFKESSHHE